jgi:hypothetical protein
METYSNEVIQIKDNYIIKNYKTSKLLISYFVLLLAHFLILIFINSAISNIKDYGFENVIFSIVIFFVYICGFFIMANDIKKITINKKENKIIFMYRLYPYIKIKKINIDKIIEILISYKDENIRYKTYVQKEKIYCIDLIDNKQNSYTLYQSNIYNEDFINYSKKIGEIINKVINDKHNIKGAKIYIKNVI